MMMTITLYGMKQEANQFLSSICQMQFFCLHCKFKSLKFLEPEKNTKKEPLANWKTKLE